MYLKYMLSITVSFCMLTSIYGAHIPQGDFKKGFVAGVRRLSQVKDFLLSASNDDPKILRVHNKADVKRCVDLQFSSLENIRAVGEKPAYLNQDRAFAGCLAGKFCLGVFDGHGKETGATISEFVRNNLAMKMLGYKSAKIGMWEGCSWMQTKIEDELYEEGKEGGTTAVVGIIQNNMLTVANVGDSRALGILQDQVVPLSIDHKPSNKNEKERILQVGGWMHNGYVFGQGGHGLALTRSFGDLLAHENEVISATPDIKTFTVVPGDVLVFASDGLWDVLSNDDVANFIKENISLGELRENTAIELSIEARRRGSRDDITVLIAVVK